MSKPIIEVKGIGKRYNILHQRGGYVALRDVLTNIAKRPFRFLTTKAKSVIGINTREDFWALRDISFEVQKGEVIGVIGRNGAGKSTLLKILTGITPPTEGEIIMRGRVASLLEVGTGFHPELTGRENIFLNGAILGMTGKEIARKFDEIVAFAGVEQFLDTPVKRYSSGMYVRLAFSVAAHMEPDILLVDEVLAVGDAEFQKKCIGKMEEVTRKEGRTIIFVSHNLATIQELCQKTVLLEKGRVVAFGDTQRVIDDYNKEYASLNIEEWDGTAGDTSVTLTHTHIKSLDANNPGILHTAAPIEITIEGNVLKPTKDLVWGFTLFSGLNQKLAYVLYDDSEAPPAPEVAPGPFLKKFTIPADSLAQGTYRVEIDIGIHNIKRIIRDEGSLVFKVHNTSGLARRFKVKDQNAPGYFRPDWTNKDTK
jgi:lipopolysaccharide transport system ATP-binding protein